MGKKIIVLILLLPLILMTTLFTAVNTVSLNVNIPVERVEVKGDDFVSLDMDNEERYFLDYVIYPTAAVNKKINVSVEPVGTQQLAEIEYIDGYIYPKSAGVAKVCVTTVDGGFRDSFQLVVKATKIRQINCSTEENWLYIGETMQINTEFVPSSTPDKTLDYLSSNDAVLTIDDDGVITARAKGTANITITSLADTSVTDSLQISVMAQGAFSLPVSQASTSANEGSVNMTVESDIDYNLTFGVYDLEDNELEGVIEAVNSQEQFTDLGNGNYKFDYKFVDEDFYDTAVIKFTFETIDQVIERKFTITKLQGLSAGFKTQDEIFYTEVGKTFNWKNQITISPSDASVEYSVEYSNDNLAISNLNYIAKANKMGATIATIIVKNKNNESEKVVLEKEVYIYPEEIYISENVGKEYGIENILTIGKYNAQGQEVNHTLTLSFGGNVEGTDFDKIKEKIVFETTAPIDKVKFEGQSIKILDDNFNAIVGVTAKLDVAGVQKSTAQFKLRLVGAGVEVNNFIDLHWATKNQKIVVLTGDIVDTFGLDAQGNNFYKGNNIDLMESTYDTKYYENIGNSNTQIITLLQFKADLYGNGHVINANNVTNVSDTDRFNGKALFNGPLNFVAMSDSGSSLVSVKAQDNVCFAIFGNTTINNVELKGCTLKSGGSTYDLTKLDYTGTTVEIFGDNVNIEYSRINNGRTVLRAFGDAEDATKAITINIKNCVLSSAREFIIRMGSNLIVRDNNELTDINNYKAPYLDDNHNISFPVQTDYNSYDSGKKSEYDQKYIKTFINIENSVLEDSGIFCVGMDSHFAGPMLVDATKVFAGFKEQLNGWKNIAGTSYGAKLTFNGDVRIYDWKNIDNIDSSTLIDNKMADVSPYDQLNLNVKDMIEALGNTSIVYRDSKGEQYVHGGIVFFGGGKNYCVFENNGQSFTGLLAQGTTANFSNYTISLKDVEMELLEKAAGDNPFYFSLYDSTSAFSLETQEIILKEASAYNCIYFND